MKVKFKSTEGEYLEAVIEFENQFLHVMDKFGGDDLDEGNSLEIDIYPGLFDEGEEWESIFSSNPNKLKSLKQVSGWSYRVYGEVIAIKPDVLVDTGLLVLEAPIETNDPRVVGEFVAFNVTRMDGCS